MPDPRRHAGLSDKELVIAFQAGDRRAYDEMFHRHRNRVRRTCGRILLNSADIEEATQETFVKAYQALGRFNGSYQLGAWLNRIATNVAIDHIRERSRSANLVALPIDREEDSVAGPEEIVAGGDIRVTDALGEIQPSHATALKLRAVEGMSHQEMAGQLHMSPDQVKALLHRARRSFKRAWDKAENWAVAPLFFLRSLIPADNNDVTGASTHAPSLFMMSPSFMPMVERVAASALLVAVALSGSPASTETPRPTSIAKDQGALVATAPDAHAREAQAGVERPSVERPAQAAEPTSAVDETVKHLEKLITDTKPEPKRDDRGGPEPEDDGGLSNPGGASNDVARKAKRTVKKVLEDGPLP